MREEIAYAGVRHEGPETPFGDEPEQQARDAADHGERRTSPPCAESGGNAQESSRHDQGVEAMAGDPEKGEVSGAAAGHRAEEAEEERLGLGGFRHEADGEGLSMDASEGYRAGAAKSSGGVKVIWRRAAAGPVQRIFITSKASFTG